MNSGRKNNFCSSYTPHTFFLLLFFILSSISSARAQPSPPPDGYPYAKFSPSMAIIIVVLVAALFFMGFFSIYIRRCSNDGGASVRAALSMRRAGRTAAASRGLDAEVLQTFPTFAYSTVKGLKIGKGALECAVCLNEFEDEETLRLIPKCDHVFHPECIDAWLENHVTCPVCRTNLVPESGESTQLAGDLDSRAAGAETDEQNPPPAAEEVNLDVSIRIGDDVVDQTQQPEVLNRNQSTRSNRPPRSKSVRGVPRMFEKFRSHSTGHSLVQAGENTDRFTLRLPDDVRKQVMNTALLNRSGSTVRLAGEGSARKGYRTGEGSSRGKPYRRMGSLDRVAVRSDRWGFTRAPSFLSRAFSVRSPKVVSDNGGASTSSTTGDKIPLNNIGPKSDEPGSDAAELV